MMARFKLPPGFRFHPTDVELMTYYLKRKVYGREIEYDIVAEVDLYKCEPWDLPEKSLITTCDSEWYFFSAPDRKYSNGSRTNRATEAGYWKATGKDRMVKTGTRKVGMKKTLVFYKGRAPHGERTNWVMHEYRLEEDDPQKVKVQDAFVLCRVFKKSGIGPKNPEYNSASLDMEEVVDTTTQGGTITDEKVAASELQAEITSAYDLTEEDSITVGNDSFKLTGTMRGSEKKAAVEDNTETSIPGESFDVHERNNVELSMLYALLLDSSNPSVSAATMANGSTSELARLDLISIVENPSSPITAQDVDMWLQEPNFEDVIDANASASADWKYSTDDDFSKKAGTPEQQQSTHHLQELQAGMLYLGGDAAQYSPDLSELDGCMLDKDLSNLSALKSFDVAQDRSLEVHNGSEEVPEADVLEELLQLITEGQRSAPPNAQTHEGCLTDVVEDVYFDVEELDMDDWLGNLSWNDTPTSQLQLGDSLEPSSGEYESWFSMPVASASNQYYASQGLSDLSMKTLHSSFEEQGQGQPESQEGCKVSPSANSISQRGDFSHEKPRSAKSSKPFSRFSRLLDSLPASPALAAEFPLNMRKQSFEPKDLQKTGSRPEFKSTRTTACSITFRCTFEFLSGVWRSSAMERSKWQTPISKDDAKASTNTPVFDIESPERTAKVHCCERWGSGCFLLVFFLGALSAVCWFLLLRMFCRLASHMSVLLM